MMIAILTAATLASCQASEPAPVAAPPEAQRRSNAEIIADYERRGRRRIRADKFERWLLLADALISDSLDLNAAHWDANGVTVTVTPAWPSHSRGRKWDAIGMAWVLLDRVGYYPVVVTIVDRDGGVIERIEEHPGAWPPDSWNP